MITTRIRQRTRDNLNRDDSGIDTKIQDWINDTKRRIEQRSNMDYTRKTATTTHTNAAPAQNLPSRVKDIIVVQYRQTAPAAEVELSWTPIPALSEAEVLRINGFASAGVLVTGAPSGYTLEESTITVHPKPETANTYTLSLAYWEFSADWTFGGGEEPYLAKFAWQAVINGATALGFSWLGQLQDAQVWETKYEMSLKEFRQHEVARALEGEISLRPRSGADDRRPSLGWSNI